MKGLPISYFKDLQDDKALVFDGYDTLKDTLLMSNELIKNINPNKTRMSIWQKLDIRRQQILPTTCKR